MPIALREKIGLTIAGFLLLVAALGALAYRSSTQFVRETDASLKAQAALSDLRAGFSFVQDLETSQRGYTVTGDRRFLEPYLAAARQLNPRLQSTRPALEEIPGGVALLDSLLVTVAMKQAELSRVIEVRRTLGFDAARDIIAQGTGRILMDQVRSQVAVLEGMIGQNVVASRERAGQQRTRAVGGLILAGLTALILAVGAGTIISRELAADRRAREELSTDRNRLSADLAGLSHELKTQAEQLTAIINAVPVALVTIEKHDEVTYWSPAAEKMFGWKPEEVLGKPLNLIPPGREEEYRRFRTQVLGGRSFSAKETRRLRRDGSELDVAISTAPLRDAEGNIHALVAAYVDLGSQRKLEEELRHSQKLEAIGRLAGGVAHDFNNLLTAIFGFTDRVKQGLPASHPQQADLTQIIAAAERAASLTRQLLVFGRPQPVAPRVLDVGVVVRTMEPMLRRLMGETIDLKCSLSSESGRVVADPHHLEQVLLNLCVNARDAMPKGGKLLIETSAVELEDPYLNEHPEISPGAYSMLAVTDTGIGMSEAIRVRIFEPYFTTKGGMGSGLGLATVYGLVRQAGGNILVYTEPGRGTSFKVYLPRTDREVTPEAEAAVAPPLFAAGIKITLVEDNPAVRSLAIAMLEDEGFEVRAFNSAEEALKETGPDDVVDLLITDVVLGAMDGAALANRLRLGRPGLPVIYMSGYTADTDMVAALRDQPGSRFLEKPFRNITLLERIAEALGGRAAASEPSPPP